jgi:hypothetical protein
MERSDWIALAACLISAIGLIPQFHGIFSKNKKKAKKKAKVVTDKKDEATGQTTLNIDPMPTETENKNKVDDVPRTPLYKAFISLVGAALFGLIALIIFSILIFIFGVEFNFNTMPIGWHIAFYLLFIIPAFLALMGILWLVSSFDD